jgi:hypothetical protein
MNRKICAAVKHGGFRLVDEGSFPHHPEDHRDAAVRRLQMAADEFVLTCRKL